MLSSWYSKKKILNVILFADLEHQTDDKADSRALGGPVGEVWGRTQSPVYIPGGTGRRPKMSPKCCLVLLCLFGTISSLGVMWSNCISGGDVPLLMSDTVTKYNDSITVFMQNIPNLDVSGEVSWVFCPLNWVDHISKMNERKKVWPFLHG